MSDLEYDIILLKQLFNELRRDVDALRTHQTTAEGDSRIVTIPPSKGASDDE